MVTTPSQQVLQAIPPTGDTAVPDGVIPREVPWRKIGWSGLAIAGWICLFSAGLLVDTFEYRFSLSPIAVVKQLDVDQINYLKSKGYQVPELADKSGVQVTSIAKPIQELSNGWLILSFLISTICYTPLNLALLALTAGLVGGWASNITAQTMPEKKLSELSEKNNRRALFLQEPPMSAALRGFIVYLCVIGGLFVVMDDPFKNPSSAQYIRLAGLLSVMAFIVGYDASRVEDWIRAIPGPRGARSTDSAQPLGDQATGTHLLNGSNRPPESNEAGLKKVPAPDIVGSNSGKR
jgi:hypothetical protein